MRTHIRRTVSGAILVSLSLLLAACGEGSGGDAGTDETAPSETTPTETAPADGPTVTVASFNFPESVMLAEIYGQALEAEGYQIERQLNLGSRELMFPAIEAGDIDLVPEYVGSALSVGFGAEAPTDLEEAVEALSASYGEIGMTVLEPAPGQNSNVFVVTQAYADENGLASVSDLADAGEVTLGGPPECETRTTCYQGLVETYQLENLAFESIQEASARLSAIESGDIDVTLLFSTDPVIPQMGLVVLEGTEEIIAPENIVPVVSQEVVDAYGEDLVGILDSISADITTELLLELNTRTQVESENPEDVAADWLAEAGITG